MNTNQLKRFAQEARIKLLKQVEAKLAFVLTSDSPELREKANEVKQLNDELSKTTKAQLIEKVAYTWFNRLMALRYMDANDYQPLGIRIITPKDGYTLPELLDAAKQGNIPDELPVKTQHIYDLLDEKVKSTNPQNEAYKELLIGACNHLNKVFPFLFERINDYTELLMPDDLISEFSIVHDVREGMSTDDCQEVEIIGWLYQFYISEKKDEVFASKSKVKREDIPAATQLFTPRWIVEYMVQNTVGKLWLQNRPNSKLREYMPYFIESASLSPSGEMSEGQRGENYLKINSPEEITLLDQACGSGHILVYGFELLAKIYEEEGYNPSEIPQLIIEKNLFGFEIDERAAQLASLALMMKARRYQRRVFRKELKPNILCFKDLNLTTDEIKKTFIKVRIDLSDELLHDLLNVQQATNLGSLIIPHSELTELERTLTAIGKNNSPDVYLTPKLRSLKEAVNQLVLLSKKHHCVVDNPPYMGGGAMNKELADFVKINYPESKADLMACFMEAGLKTLKPKGFLGMINQHSWMFLSSYEKLRESLIKNIFFDTLLHLGPRTFPEIGGEVVQNAAFTFWNTTKDDNGSYIRLVDFDKSELKRTKTLEAIQKPECGWYYKTSQKYFIKIPGSPISYWVSQRIFDIFSTFDSIETISISDGQNITANNDRFLRFHWELDNKQDNRWKLYAKGGEYRKWWGNLTWVIDWSDDARKYYRKNNSARIIPEYLWNKEGMTWTLLSSGRTGFRFLPVGATFDKTGSSIFFKDENSIMFCLAYANSAVSAYFLNIFSSTIAFQVHEIRKLPIPYEINYDSINISKTILISKDDWNTSENSHNFLQNELIRIKGQDASAGLSTNLEESYNLYQQYWQTKFFQLHKNEEELNGQFIEIYGLQEELTPDVPLEDITILKDELEQRELKKLSDSYKSGWVLNDNKWELNTSNLYENISLPFNAKEVFAQFMSYAVGCMFGRYSLDKEGLILANQGETLEDYMKIVNGGIVDSGSKDGEITKNQDYDKGLQGTEDLAAEHGVGNGCISTNETNAEGRNLQSNRSNKESSSKHSKQYSGRTSQGNKGVSSLPEDSSRVSFGIGDAIDDYNKSENVEKGTNRTFAISDNQSKKTSLQAISETSINQSPTTNHQPTFYPDDDNIIPILDEEWFEDDIVGRFNEFLKVSFGEDNFSKNLAFVEEQLGKDIRRYFMRDFYTDHIKRYKRRPIYWLFSSPKGAFNVLIYMHRYTQDTVSNILNKYLREFSGKLKTRKETLQHIIVHGDASDKTKAIKENDSIDKMLLDLHEYERDILYPIATERIPIDLDDGVLVNYNKFGNALKAVPGLNDKKTKDKVRKFDWIDSSTII